MCNELFRQRGKHRRHVRKVGDTDCHHHTPRIERLTAAQTNLKTVRSLPHRCDRLRFQVRHVAPLEFHSIVRKTIEWNRQSHVLIGQSFFAAVGLECELSLGIVQGRSKSLGFQFHSYWHLRSPGIHRVAKYTEAQAKGLEVSCDRESVRSRP